MKCNFVDSRTEFFAILAEKLGADILLERCPHHGCDGCGAGCDVVIVGLPCLAHPEFHAALMQLQKAVRNTHGIPVVAFLAAPDRQLAQIVMAAGAYDYFAETGSMEELRLVLRRAAEYQRIQSELRALRNARSTVLDFSDIPCANAKMRDVFAFAAKVASTDATVLITGETGTGKELLARALHRASPRSAQPFVAVACSSLPETLIEAELFGHERGAFTGASSARRGRFEAAEHGTIFLDEIGELTPALQVKLLRVLQERTFERIGSNQSRTMEARVICATNRNLQQLVRSGSFRADLYYRLNIIEIGLPPLRDRRDDVAMLAHTFLQHYAEKHNRPARRISAAALAALEEYGWPGNVRELQNVLERAVVLSDGPEIGFDQLPAQFAAPEHEAAVSFEDEVRSFKRRLIQRTLLENGNNKLQAARSLKIARSSLHRLIEELNVLSPPGHVPGSDIVN